MKNVALGIYTYAEFFTAAALLLPVLKVSSIRHRDEPTKRMPGRWMRRFGRWTSTMTPLWRFSVDGEAPADVLERAYVVVSNHESTADPFLLSHLRFDMRWVAKEEIFKMPLLGRLIRLCGDIPVRRGDKESVVAMLAACKETLAGGLPVMLFPEGTRSPDGRLLPFKDGAFELAIDAQVPVLPLALAGTRECRPKGSLWFGHAKARVRVLEPVPTAGMTREDLPKLRELVRERIQAAAEDLRREIGARTPPPRPEPERRAPPRNAPPASPQASA